MTKLSIVVVTWNCKKYLPEFLGSLGDLAKDRATQVIFVDNASSDGTPELVRSEFPWIELIANQKNVGFARANNQGLALAKGEFVCLVNPDVKILPGCFERMMAWLQEHDDVGLLGPRMFGGDGNVHRSTMRFPTIWSYFCNALALDTLFPKSSLFGGHLMRETVWDETKEVDILNGWFWMTRRRPLEIVGTLDERFFMYGEDMDWCKRFSSAGWKRVYFADAAAIHYGGGSSSNAPVRFYVEQQRANLQYIRKHHSSVKQFGFLATVWLYHILRILGHGGNYLIRRSNRGKAGLKIKQSMACVQWLLEGTPGTIGRN